jgi:hypothetical protein
LREAIKVCNHHREKHPSRRENQIKSKPIIPIQTQKEEPSKGSTKVKPIIPNPTQPNQTYCDLRAYAHQTDSELSLTRQIASFRSPNKQIVSTILTHQIDSNETKLIERTEQNQMKPNQQIVSINPPNKL